MTRNVPFSYRNQATIALHGDQHIEDDNAVSPALHQSVTYYAENADEFAANAKEPFNNHFYARHGNKTTSRIAKVISSLEGAETAMMFSSGMGAITNSILAFVKSGDHVIAQKNQYSATANFLNNFLPRFGINVTLVDQQSADDFAEAITSKTKVIFVETPVNPTLKLTDLKLVAKLAKENNIITICDNTLATPINQLPILLGIDLIVHSVTKYIGGHHDLLAGCVAGPEKLLRNIWDISMDLGPTAAPFNSWLALRGVRTLKLRMDQHNINAGKVATFLEGHQKVAKVYYPGLKSHPQHSLAKAQMNGFGGMVSFDLSGGYVAGQKFIKKLELCLNAASLGGVDTLAIQPAVMFKARLNDDEIKKMDITSGMIRMSVGIEDVDDILTDIENALKII